MCFSLKSWLLWKPFSNKKWVPLLFVKIWDISLSKVLYKKLGSMNIKNLTRRYSGKKFRFILEFHQCQILNLKAPMHCGRWGRGIDSSKNWFLIINIMFQTSQMLFVKYFWSHYSKKAKNTNFRLVVAAMTAKYQDFYYENGTFHDFFTRFHGRPRYSEIFHRDHTS